MASSRDAWLAALPAPPRLPTACPVAVLHLRTTADTSGNSRTCYVVIENGTGHVVEVLEEDGSGQTAAMRWPWFAHYRREAFGLPTYPGAYTVPVDVPPGEWRRWLKRTPFDSPECERLRRRADRCALHWRMVEVAESLRSHRDRHVPAWDGAGLRAMRYLEAAGLARRVHTGPNGESWVAC